MCKPERCESAPGAIATVIPTTAAIMFILVKAIRQLRKLRLEITAIDDAVRQVVRRVADETVVISYFVQAGVRLQPELLQNKVWTLHRREVMGHGAGVLRRFLHFL